MAPLLARASRWYLSRSAGGRSRRGVAGTAIFDADSYLAAYPDVAASGIDPLLHFVAFGRAEGRTYPVRLQRQFLDAAGNLDRQRLYTYLRSSARSTSVHGGLKAVPHLLQLLDTREADLYGNLLAAMASKGSATPQLRRIWRRVIANRPQFEHPNVEVHLVGDPGIANSLASVLSLVGANRLDPRRIVASTANWPRWAKQEVGAELDGAVAAEPTVRVTLQAGAIVMPGAIEALSRAVLAAGGTVLGVELLLDGTRPSGQDDPRHPSHAWGRSAAEGSSLLVGEAVGSPGVAVSTEPRAMVMSLLGEGAAANTPQAMAAGQSPPLRALVIDAQVPASDQDAGSAYATDFMRVLTQLGFSVTFMAADLRLPTPHTAQLEALGVAVFGEPYIHSYNDLFDSEYGRFDVAVIFRPFPFAALAAAVRAGNLGIPLIYVTVDLHHRRMAGQVEYDASIDLMEAVETMRELERSNALSADATVVVSASEVGILAALAPSSHTWVVPLAVEAGAPLPVVDWSERHDIVFLGGYRHRPNVDAVLWFLDEVWPLVEAELPLARFVAYGSAMPEELQERNSVRTVMHGYVRSTDDAFLTARIGVVPLRFGAGIKGKILTTMAAGVPVVSTPVGADGMGFAAESIVVASSASELAGSIIALYNDEARLDALRKAAYSDVSERFSTDAMKRSVRALLSELGVLPAERH